ncbi:MAG TPA: nucleotide exchange factor GrpE [Gemmatimonadales bacterium]|nr:nucleotide exchange factor GrpE [Gemmatimonadales bacterium]
MTKHKDKHPVDAVPSAPPVPEGRVTPEGGALVEPAPEAVVRLESELGEARVAAAQATDKYLRLAAEFDNYKKRSIKERTEAHTRAQADLIARLVDALDDLARFAHVDPSQTDAKTIHDGVDMVERKVWKQLDAIGVTRIDQPGVPFDPNQHEAVTMAPAAAAVQDHTVGAILQPGYKIGDALIRPARVVVLNWQGDAPATPQPDGRPVADS